MRDIKMLLVVMCAFIFALGVAMFPVARIATVDMGIAIAQAQDDSDAKADTTDSAESAEGATSTESAESEDDWDDWDDEEGDEEDAFGNIMETTFATIGEVTVDGATAGSDAKVTATITLEDEEEEATISSVKLSYSVDGGAVSTVDMSDNGDGTYSGTIPVQASGAKVEYYITVTDSNNNVTTGALPGHENVVSGVADMDNSEDIVADDADLIDLAAGYDDDYLYVDFSVQGAISGGTIDPPYIQLYGVKITNPDTEQGEGLMVGKLWIYLPLAKEKEVQDKFMPMLMDAGKEYIDQIGQENIDRVMQTGMMVLDIQKLMGGNFMEGMLFSAEPEADIDGGKFSGKIKRAALGDNPSGYLRIITLTAANASIDSFMPIPLNCSNFLTIYTSDYSYEVK